LSRSKNNKLKSTGVRVFSCSAGRRGSGGQRGRKHSRAPVLVEFTAAAREPTRRQWRWRVEGRGAGDHTGPEDFPCTVKDLWGLFCNF
jgi:hypothetical protein